MRSSITKDHLNSEPISHLLIPVTKKWRTFNRWSSGRWRRVSFGYKHSVNHMSWEGYNFGGAAFISTHSIYKDISTFICIKWHKIEVHVTNKVPERITKEIIQSNSYASRHLDKNGVVNLWSWRETGDVVVGQLASQRVWGAQVCHTPKGRLLQVHPYIQVQSTYTCIHTSINIVQNNIYTTSPSISIHTYIHTHTLHT